MNEDIRYFPPQETVGEEEINAVKKVMETGILSHFRGNSGPNFFGGPELISLEGEFKAYFNSKHAISVNSCTSALQMACLAIGLKEGDEVIVTPWSMTCSATAPLICGAKPVFADIEEDYFCLSLESVIKMTTDKTKAIIAVSLFGQVFDPGIKDFAESRGIIVIEDAAQAIGSTYVERYRFADGARQEKFAGTLGDIGCFSFTQGKHITCGEGGMLLTDNSFFAEKLSLIRNHAEAVIHDCTRGYDKQLHTKDPSVTGLWGGNFRMTEVSAAILREQLKKLPSFVERRRYNTKRLNHIFTNYPEFILPACRLYGRHSYYVYALTIRGEELYSEEIRSFVTALNEGLPKEKGRDDKTLFNYGYIDPLYRMPVFQSRPDLLPFIKDMKNVERLQSATIITTLIGLPLSEEDFELIDKCVEKNISLLRR